MIINSFQLQRMKHNNHSAKPLDKFSKRLNLLSKNSNPALQSRNHSLKILMQLKMLPPLHPQTDTKKTNSSKNCPEVHEEELFTIHHPQMAAIAKSQQVVPYDSTATAKFGFDNVQLQTSVFGKDTIQFETLQNEIIEDSQKKSNGLVLTFGKKGIQLQRFNEIQKQNQNNTPSQKLLPQMKSINKKGKMLISRASPLVQKNERGIFKLGKYDCVFKPKQYKNMETEPSKHSRNTVLQNIKLKEKNPPLLPPILSKN